MVVYETLYSQEVNFSQLIKDCSDVENNNLTEILDYKMYFTITVSLIGK